MARASVQAIGVGASEHDRKRRFREAVEALSKVVGEMAPDERKKWLVDHCLDEVFAAAYPRALEPDDCPPMRALPEILAGLTPEERSERMVELVLEAAFHHEYSLRDVARLMTTIRNGFKVPFAPRSRVPPKRVEQAFIMGRAERACPSIGSWARFAAVFPTKRYNCHRVAEVLDRSGRFSVTSVRLGPRGKLTRVLTRLAA